MLADRVPHTDGLPTRAAILAALAALPDRMHRGELAFLYFAGHGSQQPQGDRDWTKADGLDETFLARDVGRWDGANGRVEGAIVGSEFGHAIDALRARSVAPQTLGVPGIAHPGPGRTAVERVVRPSNRALPGGYVAFYGAQTAETAPEMPLPAGAPDRQTHGLFTYALLQALGASGSGSYREVAHRILAFYTMSYPDTTPEFEGALDEPIGAEGSPLIPGDWPAVRHGSEFHIAAGRLNTVTAGSLLALSPAFAANARTIPAGLLRVRRATLTEAWADPVTEPTELARWHVKADRSDELGAGVAHLRKPGALHLEVWVRDTSGARQRLGVDRSAIVTRGAQLVVRLQNTGSDDLDVTILSLDERFGIEAVFPVDQESNRLPRNSAPIELPGWAGAPGRYELIVIGARRQLKSSVTR